jgi:hypothetical protein
MMPLPLPSSPRTQRSAEEITMAERALGVRFPEPYRRFLRRHDGVKPPSNVFPVDPDQRSSVHAFVPLAELAATRDALADRLPIGTLPIAGDEVGNHICLDLARDGRASFWDHETERAIMLAPDFAVFLELLVPFDPASIALDPDDVISVWIDPALLSELKARKDDAAG